MSGGRALAPTAWDAAAAAALAVAVLASRIFALSTPRVTGWATAAGFLCAAVLLARTRLPMPTLFAVALLAAAPTLVTGSYPDFYGSFVPVLVAVYTVALLCSTREAAIVPLVVVAVVSAFAARVPAFGTPAELVYTLTGLALAFGAGRTMRLLRQRADVEAARADLLAQERGLQAREAVVAERERIARELHDVIAHDVTVMVVQAGAAERLAASSASSARWESSSERLGSSLAQIQASGRKAIDELHLLLGMLRDDDQALVAQPGLSALEPLVHELARTGMDVSLDVRGQVRDVGAALDLSAYRLVQEALTNVLKHAGGSRTCVTLEYGRADLTLRIVDDGTGADARRSAVLPSSGNGLVGMRERVRLFGGTLTTGADPVGGWAVTAVLPIPAPR